MSEVSTDAASGCLAADHRPGTGHDAAQGTLANRDAQCIRQALAGDRTAFAVVALNWQDRIYNALCKLTGNEHDAADLTQETFARALDNLNGFRGDSSAYTWLFRIALNLAASRQRQIGRRKTIQAGQIRARDEDQPVDVLDNRPGAGDAPPVAAEKRERDGKVMEALARLDEPQQRLLVLRDIEGMDYQQMAEVLEVPLGTLKSRLFRARMALREQLKDYFVFEAKN